MVSLAGASAVARDTSELKRVRERQQEKDQRLSQQSRGKDDQQRNGNRPCEGAAQLAAVKPLRQAFGRGPHLSIAKAAALRPAPPLPKRTDLRVMFGHRHVDSPDSPTGRAHPRCHFGLLARQQVDIIAADLVEGYATDQGVSAAFAGSPTGVFHSSSHSAL